MSASASRGNALQGLKSSPLGARNSTTLTELRMKSCHLKINDSLQQLATSYSDHP
jgi:hypothetical protein